ncbi:hypothetical protein ACF6ZU_00245 [Pseudomonas migulae]|uniref:hypothetical protein n=1 Tax=Pseudomonas migulae TaxID=78543 RepID=UPI00372423C5
MADLIQGLDGPRTAQQELFYDLEDASAVIRWAVGELTDMAEFRRTPDEAMALMKMGALLEVQRHKLAGYADEVKAGGIVRAKACETR